MTVEQEELRDVVCGFLAKHRVKAREPGSFDKALWRRLAGELGLTGLAIDGAHGDCGAPTVEVAIVLEELGRALLALPYLSTMVAAAVLPGAELAAVAAGEAIGALAVDAHGLTATRVGEAYQLSGRVERVMDGDVATVAVVRASDDGQSRLFAVPLDGVDREPLPTLDQSRPVATLIFDAAPAVRLAASPEHARDLLHVALAVESLGTAAASLESVVTHLRTRHQFGTALANFQALRHRVADLAVALEGATSTAWYAVRAPLTELPLVAPMAKLVAADAAYTITAETIQLHGGIGFTWEHDAHRYFKRATVTRLGHGDPATLRRQIAAHAGLPSI